MTDCHPKVAPYGARAQGLRGLTRCLLVGAAAGLAACSHVSDRAVLLPSASGKPSALEVSRGTQSVRLDQPYAAVALKGDEWQPVTMDAASVQQRYGALLALQPPRPERFVVRFEANGNRLAAEADAELARMRARLAQLPAPEVIVTGHTDTVGPADANDRLSLARAATVRDLLVAAGVPLATISIIGRGEREPDLATADEVAEARNRRVEIKLR